MKSTIASVITLLMITLAATPASARKLNDMRLSTPLRAVKAVEVEGVDLITKVYGAVDPGLTKSQLVVETAKATGVIPSEDEYGLWLDSEDGYTVCYRGMMPATSAVANFDGDKVADFAFFFMFPYDDDNREAANQAQCNFCSSLLQELDDMGLPMRASSPEGTLFEANSEFAGNRFNIRLVDNAADENRSARFLVVVSVDPATMQALNAMR